MSIEQMLEQNYQLNFDKDECKIRDRLKSNTVFTRAKMIDDKVLPLYFTKGNQTLRTNKMNDVECSAPPSIRLCIT